MWEGGITSMASFQAMVHGIHVLLVDHDTDALVYTAKQLEMCRYRVTMVEFASAGISMLLSGMAKFDVVVANINSPDLHGFKLLHHSLDLCIPVILISEEENASVAMRALKDGAFLCMKKPLSMEFVRCLWQHVVREKTRLVRERDMRLLASHDIHDHDHDIDNNNNNLTLLEKGKSKSKSKKGKKNVIECRSDVRRKMCTEWTQQLHAKFMNAIQLLGEGRCFPKEILEAMNEPGLTRMQVASHLQKCRTDNWKPPDERKSSHQIQTTTQPQVSKPRRFGSKPFTETGQGSETHSYMDGLTRDFSGGRLEPGINDPGRPQRGFVSFRPNKDVQKFEESSSRSKNRWSNWDTSNLEGDQSKTKNQDKLNIFLK